MLYNTRAFASNALAVLAVGTCSSFGGIPNGRGSQTDARGLLYQGNSAISTVDGSGKGALNDPALGPIITTPVINISGCPPHPDWIVGTIAHILSTNITLPPVTSYNRPIDYGYKEYQCNAGPCPWRYNNTPSRNNQNSGTDNSTAFPEPDYNARYPLGDSQRLGREKYTSDALGCLGILGCKGRKTKADCSRRRWNADAAEQYGVNWCVGSRGGCHGCTEPTFPDKVGKFFTFA
jgi:hydrogenase small subunit